MSNVFVNGIAKLRTMFGVQKHPEFDTDSEPALAWLQKAAEAKYEIENFYKNQKTSPNKLSEEQIKLLNKLKRDLKKYKLHYVKAQKKADMTNAEEKILKMAKRHQKNGVYNQVVFDKMILCIRNKSIETIL